MRECDDGNNADGDGCSSSCLVEQGYTCKGGSPSSADNCVIFNPSRITFSMVGQVRFQTRVVLNIKIDFLPRALLQSADCNDRCSQVLQANVVDGEKPTSVRSSFVSGSRYSFSVELEFGRPYMGRFRVEIKVNPALSRYFQNVGITNTFVVDVNPSQLTLARREDARLA